MGPIVAIRCVLPKISIKEMAYREWPRKSNGRETDDVT